MSKNLILTFIADDRPGLVGRLSRAVAEAGGNWLDSRMAHLGGKFAGIAEVEVADGTAAALEAALAGLADEGFHLVVEEAGSVAAAGGHAFELELVGPDHPGIVRDISQCLAERGVSVEEMETEIFEAPHAGGTLFQANLRVRAPAGLSDDDLQDALAAVAESLMVDITLGKIL